MLTENPVNAEMIKPTIDVAIKEPCNGATFGNILITSLSVLDLILFKCYEMQLVNIFSGFFYLFA